MVALMPSSKVAPRRHWSSMQGLLMHSRQLHQVLKAVEHQESREQCRRLLSAVDFQEPVAIVPKREAIEPTKSRTIVFRKTKREIQRERELAQQQQRQLAVSKKKSLEEQRPCPESDVIVRRLDNLRATLLASCKHGSTSTMSTKCPSTQQRLTSRAPYLQRKPSGLSRRCPPRRRLLF